MKRRILKTVDFHLGKSKMEQILFLEKKYRKIQTKMNIINTNAIIFFRH